MVVLCARLYWRAKRPYIVLQWAQFFSIFIGERRDPIKIKYGQRVREVERGVFTPLVFSTNGEMGKEATTFYRRLADMIAQKRQYPYSVVMR